MAKRVVKGMGKGRGRGLTGFKGLFLGSVRQCGVSRGQVCRLGYQHPDTDAKTAQTGETIRREGEMEETSSAGHTVSRLL